MIPESDVFSLSGPIHLKPVDWNNAFNRRSVAASLVQGVSIHERDRQHNRHGFQALAPPWWDFFDFRLNDVLVDEDDASIFCSIYEFKYPAPAGNVPKYVIAFRGTLMEKDTILQDLAMDLRCCFNKLHNSPRFQRALDIVQNTVALAGAANVWLAGHSLGSAMALLAGKSMAKMGCFLETYLFNPPFLSVPIEWIEDNRVKHGIRFTRSFLKAGLTIALNGCRFLKHPELDTFVGLSQWIPYLFVNPNDHFCSDYIGYFEQRKKMNENGAGR
ncbi:hypothetical protein CJ030_MR7G016711 [Morella rubra]|uniref:Fungal lipase-type domain-containing protein n=1 Tax=Morella rubra TaxID=262757 RepID=A0A6A1UZJ2_9ROSI|nr:hypothetical protein CJ030_MR7G016711 [Morella rubra]